LIRLNRCPTALAVALSIALPAWPTEPEYFVPAHRLPGIGVDRQELTDDALALRAEAMIQSQTFGIMREPLAAQGAERIHGSGLERLFREAEHKSGFPASVLQAMAYLESWGVANAESPAGPRGILQISEATGKRIGLRIVYATRHRTIKTQTAVRNKHGKLVYRTVRRKETYTVLVRDDRLKPEKAIPAAAMYLAGMERRYGGRDWAIWAYHCGEGCVADFRAMAKSVKGLDDPPASVAKVFFGCSPVWNRDLCAAIHAQMDRDYSPTYWFRVMRAEQLLSMYRDDAPEFRDLAEEYKYSAAPAQRAPDRLSAWLKPQDSIYETGDVIRNDRENKLGSKLVGAPDAPEFFGYRVDGLALPMGQDEHDENENWRAKALPSTIGTLAYIAFETRRLYAALRPGETFVPLEATALVLPKAEGGSPDRVPGARTMDHASGQVFDLSVSGLPPGEQECLRFVLDDLGWNGDLGFIEESPGTQTLHIGCSPASRDFFAQVFEEAQTALRDRRAPPPAPGTPPVAH
jgi:soluble lytic murein transglycosylase-like protein